MANLIDISLYFDKDCTKEVPLYEDNYIIEIGSITKEAQRLKIFKLYAKNTGSKNALLTSIASRINADFFTCNLKEQNINPNQIVPFEIVIDLKENMTLERFEFCIRSQYVIKIFGTKVGDLQGIPYNALSSNVTYSRLFFSGIKRVETKKNYKLKLYKKDKYGVSLKDGQTLK